MNLRNLITLLAVGAVLCTGGTGCKKRLQKVTPLPGSETGMTGTAGTLPDAGTVGTGGTGSSTTGTDISGGFPQTGDFSGWAEDRAIFRDQTVYFDFDKSVVRANEVPKLETVASRMTAFPDRALRIEGHCDERGTEGYNDALGDRRALAVREHLIRLGIGANRIETVTFGENRPVDPGHSEAAWSKNRRAEILLLTRPAAATP